MVKRLLALFFSLSTFFAIAQTEVSGLVFDEYLEPFPGVSIRSSEGESATSNIDGEFTIKVKKFPVTINVSLIGYQTEVLQISDASEEINVILKETFVLDQVVVSASRTPERIIESPVTIERIGIADIKRNTSVSFYDGLVNLKGIDSYEANYGFKSINSRGFSTFDNTRFVQLVDGVETSIPATNFSVGNLVGPSELDVKNVEILPGASSALYGANAFNGILLMRTKSPFEFEGVSTYVKSGFISQEATEKNDLFYDVGARMAYKFSDKFAGKVNFTYFDAEEWHANDLSNTSGIAGVIIPGTRASDTNYDGVNVYGDEVSANINEIAQLLELGGLIPTGASALVPDVDVSRTGYAETDLVNYDGHNMKFDGSLHYRPWGNDKLEVILNSRFSRGNNIYQGSNRFSQKNYYVEQYKLEVLGKNFFLRGYYTGNDSGQSADLRFLGIGIDELNKPSSQWYGEYIGAFLATGSHAAARNVADNNRFVPGTQAFQNALNTVSSTPISNGGAAITDVTSYYHGDANYNFRDLIDWAEVQVGGSFRRHLVNSNGTLFTDLGSQITFDNYGVYTQIQKKFLNNKLKFTGSVRYDKSKNFEGNFSPRVALNYALDENNDHILRASYQTGFRNPSILEQYSGLRIGPNRFSIGTAEENLDRFVTVTANNNGTTSTITGRDAFSRALLPSSVFAGAPVKANVSPVKPETVTSYELGYRSIIGINDDNILELDINGYYNQYQDFVAFKDVIIPNYGSLDANGQPDALALGALAAGDITAFNLNTNSIADISSYGFGLGASTKVFGNFNFGLNYTLSKLIFDQASDPEFNPGFNTPEHQVKVSFGNPKLFKNVGFNINARWQDSFLWQSSFLTGVINSRTVIDAQLNYRVPVLKSRFKIGATNLTGEEYVVAPGSGSIGSVYYISWTIND